MSANITSTDDAPVASPGQALDAVLCAVTDYTASPELGTFAALMTSVVRYGRACRHDDRAMAEAEQAEGRLRVGELMPSSEAHHGAPEA
jgi:hypothetical protein